MFVKPYFIRRGKGPLVVSFPHSGETLGTVAERMRPAARPLPDTDWHLLRLYDFLDDMNITIIKGNYSRYVIDLNRDPSGKALYKGENETELCPTTMFDETPIYDDGQEPNDAEIAERIAVYHEPYHDAIASEIERIKDINGHAVLLDAHSIAQSVPRFFDGALPDLNLGTVDGTSCDKAIADDIMAIFAANPAFSSVLDGRFKGGYITRKYGDPSNDVHALQLELSQATYMIDSDAKDQPGRGLTRFFDDGIADKVRPVLFDMVHRLAAK